VSAAKSEVAGGTPATTEATMLYMVIEHFKEGAVPDIYRRFREKGRMMPDGLNYVSSWIDTDLKVCYQLMETEDVTLFERWTRNWDDLMEFKIVPVRTSAETAAQVD
jgi:Protein of unknown function (DUF3303)